MTRITDLANRRFGKLLVVQRVSRPEEIKQGTYWLCKCDCGNKKIIWSWSLISGITNSCGCLRKKNIGLYQSAINRLFRSYKRVAEKRGLYFNISLINDLPRKPVPPVIKIVLFFSFILNQFTTKCVNFQCDSCY